MGRGSLLLFWPHLILIIVIIGIVFIALNGGFDPLGKPFGNVIILVLIYRRKRTTRDEMDKPVAGKTADDQPRANQSSGRATHASATNPLRRARA